LSFLTSYCRSFLLFVIQLEISVFSPGCHLNPVPGSLVPTLPVSNFFCFFSDTIIFLPSFLVIQKRVFLYFSIPLTYFLMLFSPFLPCFDSIWGKRSSHFPSNLLLHLPLACSFGLRGKGLFWSFSMSSFSGSRAPVYSPKDRRVSRCPPFFNPELLRCFYVGCWSKRFFLASVRGLLGSLRLFVAGFFPSRFSLSFPLQSFTCAVLIGCLPLQF